MPLLPPSGWERFGLGQILGRRSLSSGFGKRDGNKRDGAWAELQGPLKDIVEIVLILTLPLSGVRGIAYAVLLFMAPSQQPGMERLLHHLYPPSR